MIDQDLIISIKNGDRAAFKQLYTNSIRYVYSIVRRYVSNESDHQDVIQEIFARVFLRIGQYDIAKGDFKFWLRRLTINQCIEFYRKQKRTVKIVSIESAGEKTITPDRTSSSLTRKEIDDCLKRMPEGYRKVFMLVIIDDYSHQDVAKMLDISAETSRSQLHRAKKWLKENLSTNELEYFANGL